MKSQLYLWLHGLLSQIIEGSSDAFLAVMGGNTAAQLATSQMPATTPKQLLLSMAVLSGIYAASYLKKNPLPRAEGSEQSTANIVNRGGPIEPPVSWPRTSSSPSPLLDTMFVSSVPNPPPATAP